MYLTTSGPRSGLLQYSIATPPKHTNPYQAICLLTTTGWCVLNIDLASAWLVVDVQDAVGDSLIDEIGQKLASGIVCEVSILELEKLESTDWRGCGQSGQDRVCLIAAQIVVA